MKTATLNTMANNLLSAKGTCFFSSGANPSSTSRTPIILMKLAVAQIPIRVSPSPEIYGKAIYSINLLS